MQRIAEWFRGRAHALGLGNQDEATLGFAALGAVGFLLTFAAMQLALFTTRHALFSGAQSLRFDPVRWDSPSYWSSEAPLAGERMEVFIIATAMVTTLALLTVFFLLAQRYHVRMAVLIVGAGVIVGTISAEYLSTSGELTRFLLFKVTEEAQAAARSHLPPQASDMLKRQLIFVGQFGFSAAFATAFAAIVFALRGPKDVLSPHALRARWRAVFTLYIVAMAVVALIAVDARAILEYAAAPLLAPDEAAHDRLSAITATYMGVSCGILLIISCLPGFLSIRRDIELKAQECAAAESPQITPEDWIRRENLDVTPLKTLATALATLAPALMPASADIVGAIRLPF